jgi:hypothetical protein
MLIITNCNPHLAINPPLLVVDNNDHTTTGSTAAMSLGHADLIAPNLPCPITMTTKQPLNSIKIQNLQSVWFFKTCLSF